MLNLYSNTRKDGIFMNRRANSSYFHEATKKLLVQRFSTFFKLQVVKQKTLGMISWASKKQEIRDNRFPYEKINL
jgi:hypothetical protein